MSGQASRKFNVAPGNFAEVGNIAQLGQVETASYQGTAAQYSGDTRGLGAIGHALGSFFNATQQALQTVDQVNHREDLIQIDRENKALAKQAHVDQQTGKVMDPEHADRAAYAQAYEVSAADAHAFELGEKLRAHMAQQPLDGSVDLNAVARDFFKEQVGNGTGQANYDSRLIAQFSRAADQQIAQYQEASRAVVMQNSTQEVLSVFAQRVLSKEGITTPQFAEMRDRIGALVHGNNEVRDKVVMAAIASAVQNDGQGMSVLRAMQELGLDQSEPDQFNRISGEVLKRTNSIKTFDAGQQVQQWTMDLATEKSRYLNGILPPERALDFLTRAHDIDSIHGTGLGPFQSLLSEFSRGVEREAGVNLWAAARNGDLGTQDGARVASAYGKSPSVVLNEHYDSGVSMDASRLSPTLAATRDGTGLIQPMQSLESVKEFGKYVLDPGVRKASLDSMSDTFKREIGDPLTGRDPAAMEKSFSFYDTLRQGGLTKEQMHRYFPGEKAENTYWAMQLMSNGDRGIKQIAKDLTDRPFDAKEIERAAETGRIDLAAVARKGGVTGKPEDIDRKITEGFTASILDSTDRKKWFGSQPVGFDSNELAVRDALLLDTFQLHQRVRGSIDLDKAVESLAKQTGKFILVPGQDGALQAVRDPFKGAGQQLAHPLNEDPSHPLSVAKGYAPIYAPGTRITNAAGKPEDLLVTWAEDAANAHKAFPGLIPEGGQLYLERPNAAGLSSVRDDTGRQIQFLPGQPVAIGKATTPTPVPEDPQEAAEFFRKNLGPGWYVQQDGFLGPKGAGYTLYYGARIKTGEAELQTQIEQRQQSNAQYRQDTLDSMSTVDTGGNAAIRYRNALGAAGTKASQDTTDNGASWGELGAGIADAAGKAVDKYQEIGQKQRDAVSQGFEFLKGSQRLKNAAGILKGE